MQNKQVASIRQTKPLHYAIGMFGTSIPINMFKTYALYFYVDLKAAMTVTQFGLILAIYTFLDAIDNPIYGLLSDRTRSPWGRRKPWLIVAAPLLALSFIFFFSPPALEQNGIFIYALLLYSLTGTLDSLINANYGALFPELYRSESERSKTNAIRQVFQLLAMIISIALTPIITDKLGYQTTAILYAILAVTVIWFMAFNVHETPEAQKSPQPPVFLTLKHILTNPKFWIFGFGNAAFYAAFSTLQQSVSFFTKYVLETEGYATTILLASVILMAMLSIPVWIQFIKRWQVMKSWRFALILIATSLLPLLIVKSLPTSLVSLVILGFGYGGTLATTDLVGAKILDEDFNRYQMRREGIYNSLLGMLNKTSGLLSSFAFLLVSKLFGYVNGENVGPNPAFASRFLISIFPFIAMLIAILFSYLLKFDSSTNVDTSHTELGMNEKK